MATFSTAALSCAGLGLGCQFFATGLPVRYCVSGSSCTVMPELLAVMTRPTTPPGPSTASLMALEVLPVDAQATVPEIADVLRRLNPLCVPDIKARLQEGDQLILRQRARVAGFSVRE